MVTAASQLAQLPGPNLGIGGGRHRPNCPKRPSSPAPDLHLCLSPTPDLESTRPVLPDSPCAFLLALSASVALPLHEFVLSSYLLACADLILHLLVGETALPTSSSGTTHALPICGACLFKA